MGIQLQVFFTSDGESDAQDKAGVQDKAELSIRDFQQMQYIYCEQILERAGESAKLQLFLSITKKNQDTHQIDV